MSLAHRFEARAAQYPDLLAVKSPHAELSYHELMCMADSVAHAVRTTLNETQCRVALLMGHEGPAIAAMIGILKTSNIYVPLNPADPANRLQAILKDSGAGLIVTDRVKEPLCRELAGAGFEVISIDDLGEPASSWSSEDLISPDLMAALLYTSGSTGKPKGVVHTHGSLSNWALSVIQQFRIDADDRLTLLTFISHAAATSNIYGALLSGASLHLYDVSSQGIAGLGEWIHRERITFYHSVPSLFLQLANTIENDHDLSSLRIVRLGGEPLRQQDVDLFRLRIPASTSLVNSFGMTECGSICMDFLDSEVAFNTSTVPVGYALSGVEIRLFDGAGDEVRVGEVGEIAVRSSSLASGYWRQPELSAVAFGSSSNGPDRIFRTGDFGRFSSDGCLEITGRQDQRINIHGQRIEIGEVEAAILAHPGVDDVVVVAREHKHGGTHLVAFLVEAGPSSLKTESIKGFLAERLPLYMIPSRWVLLDRLPRLSNGKVDRLGLPAPVNTRPDMSTPYVAPRVLIEKEMAFLWEDVLDVSPIGIHDRFFDLGGDSLSALSLISAIERHYRITLPVSSIITSDTISRLVAVLIYNDDSRPLVPLVSKGIKPPLFCIHSGAGNVLCYRTLAEQLAQGRPVYAVQWLGLDGKYPLQHRVESMAREYVTHITEVQPHGPYHLLGYSFGGLIAYEMAQQLYQQGRQVAAVVLIDTKINVANKPLDLPVTPRLPGLRRRLRSLGHEMKNPRKAFTRLVNLAVSLSTQAPLRRRAWKRLLLMLGLGHGTPLPPHERIDFYLSMAFAATRVYVPRVCPCPIILFESKYRPRKEFWRRMAGGSFECHSLDCGHFNFFESPYLEIIAEELTSYLDGNRSHSFDSKGD